MTPLCFWEILVPTIKDSKPVKTKYHLIWDEKVRQLTGGLTIMPPNIKGEWVSSEGKIFAERMIPVRIMATPEEIREIADFTCRYYNQQAVMYYLISSNVIIHKPSDSRVVKDSFCDKIKESLGFGVSNDETS